VIEFDGRVRESDIAVALDFAYARETTAPGVAGHRARTTEPTLMPGTMSESDLISPFNSKGNFGATAGDRLGKSTENIGKTSCGNGVRSVTKIYCPLSKCR
jgi:hypothetical protein